MCGQQILRELFPNLMRDLMRAGATQFDLLGDSRLCLYREWLNPIASDQIMVGCSRVLLEATLRRHRRARGAARNIYRLRLAHDRRE